MKIHNYVVNFMDNNDTINISLASEKKHSIQHAAITLVDKIIYSLDSGDFIIGVFLDLKKHLTL